ncbi:SDR family oxidoreductase [Streptomyces olindensis]|uniref:SDR family oxidoreductase n=1 Tax=Streptomyces olindensis TaxID=358823 RepID=A0ABV2XP23_9ACTN
MALISGTARGQGRAAAPRFAAEGAIVGGGDLRHESELKAQRLVAQAGGTALAPGPLDATDEDSVRFGAADTQPYEDFGCTMRAELDSVWLPAHVARPHRVRSRTSIVTVGSPASLTGSLTNQRTACPHGVQGPVIAMTWQLAAEGAPYGIRANCVSPGRSTPRPRAATPPADDQSHVDHRPPHLPRPRRAPRGGRQRGRLPRLRRGGHITGANLVVDDGRSSVLPS